MRPHRTNLAANAAAFGALAMIANQVGIKAARDALFLSSLGVEALPAMIAVAAVFSILVVLVASRVVATYGPAVVVPRTFLLSAVLLLGEWPLWYRDARVGSVVIYLHAAALGSFLVSGFWSMINERFDPRSGKQMIAIIARGAALGGLVGGIVAERVAAASSAVAMLPILATMHIGCAIALFYVSGLAPIRNSRNKSQSRPPSGIRSIATVPYLRSIAALVVLTACSGTLIDYAFKVRAYANYGEGEELLRFFALFYAGVGVVTLISQSLLSRTLLEKFGLSRTVGVLPLVTGVGSVAMLAVPGLGVAAAARAGESTIRSSVFRSSYELLYVPMSERRKRASKPIIDVGCDRIGDVLGAAFISLLILVLVDPVASILLVALVLAGAAFRLSGRLQAYYVDTLKGRLVHRAEELDMDPASSGGSPSNVLNTLRTLNLNRVLRRTSAGASASGSHARPRQAAFHPAVRSSGDSMLSDLASSDLPRVKTALADVEVTPAVAQQIIELLAWDEVSDEAIASLRKVAPSITGQLIDALVNQAASFATRRRIPRVLSECDSRLAVEGLMMGLKDRRFEVRYQCAGALSRIRDRIRDIGVDRERLVLAVLDELAVDPARWRARRLIDSDHAIESERRLNRKLDLSLEHIFRLLSLFLDKEPMRIALRGLYTDDEQLRGTALEYLESVLPVSIRVKIWHLLEDRRPERTHRTEREALSKLLLSKHSIERKFADG